MCVSLPNKDGYRASDTAPYERKNDPQLQQASGRVHGPLDQELADAFGDARRSSRFPAAQTAGAVGPEPFRKLIAGASTFPRAVINAAQKQTS